LRGTKSTSATSTTATANEAATGAPENVAIGTGAIREAAVARAHGVHVLDEAAARVAVEEHADALSVAAARPHFDAAGGRNCVN
jgi:hypothetical protein